MLDTVFPVIGFIFFKNGKVVPVLRISTIYTSERKIANVWETMDAYGEEKMYTIGTGIVEINEQGYIVKECDDIESVKIYDNFEYCKMDSNGNLAIESSCGAMVP